MSLEELIDEYDRDHQNPTNRVLHIVGITLIGSSVVLIVVAPPLGVAAFAAGWAAQLIGHRLEGNKPSFTRQSKFMAVGAFWYVRTVRRFAARVTAHA